MTDDKKPQSNDSSGKKQNPPPKPSSEKPKQNYIRTIIRTVDEYTEKNPDIRII